MSLATSLGFTVIFVLFAEMSGEEILYSGGRIFHGNTIDIDDYPFFGLVMRTKYIGKTPLMAHCGCSLISKRFLVTAHHCIGVSRNPNALIVIMRVRDRCRYDESGTVVRLEQIFAPHGIYEEGLESPEHHDIALLKTRIPVEGIEPIQLPREPPRPNELGKVIGFGLTKSVPEQFQRKYLACVLQEGAEMVRMPELCPKLDLASLKGTFCGVDPTFSGVTACRGDSGGPWIAMRNSSFTLIGVSSFGDEKCVHIDAYTDVYNNMNWIHRVIGPTLTPDELIW